MSNEFIQSNITSNRVQSVALIFAMVCVLALIGVLMAGPMGVAVAIGLCVIAILFGPGSSPQLVLRMYKAQQISRQASPQLFDVFTELVKRADIGEMPTLHYIPSRTLNAFAVGNSKQSAVAITDGLLRMLSPREIAGVLAHEVSHIRHRDMKVLGIADTVSRIIGTLSQIGQMMLLLAIPTFLMNGGYLLLFGALMLIASPLVSNALQMALSRSREFNADLGAVALTGDAQGLASALAKLERITSGTGFPWIVPGRKSQTVPALLRTHPATDERIRRILEAGDSLGLAKPEAVPHEVERRLAPGDQPRVRQGPGWHIAGLWY